MCKITCSFTAKIYMDFKKLIKGVKRIINLTNYDKYINKLCYSYFYNYITYTPIIYYLKLQVLITLLFYQFKIAINKINTDVIDINIKQT